MILIKIILISGKAQNGKDTIATLLQKELKKDNKCVLITHYADLLKFICTNYFDWDGNKDEEGRELLQHVGTEIIRKKNPNLWVDFVATMLDYFDNHWDYVIIPDCRFPNEITKLTDKGFDVVHLRVVRESFDSLLTDAQKTHSSETALDEIIPDYYINNDGSIADLEVNINKWIEEELNKIT